jgi:nucleotide-binding universal stress UspA family protein
MRGEAMNTDPTTILFATDGTSASQRARGAAAHLAGASNAALHVVHVWAPGTTVSDAPDVAERIGSAVAGSEARVIEAELGCPVAGVHAPEGSRAHGILAVAGAVGAGLIVVGGRKLGVVEELFTYRVSEDVIHHSLRPVLLVRQDGQEWPPQHVVVGCDLLPEALRAAGLAAWVARCSGAELELVAVVNSEDPDRDEAIGEATRRLEELAARLRTESGPNVTVRVVVGPDVASALRNAATASGSQLLAVGARGSSLLHRVTQFSVSRSLIHHTHLPLLLVPRASSA